MSSTTNIVFCPICGLELESPAIQEFQRLSVSCTNCGVFVISSQDFVDFNMQRDGGLNLKKLAFYLKDHKLKAESFKNKDVVYEEDLKILEEKSKFPLSIEESIKEIIKYLTVNKTTLLHITLDNMFLFGIESKLMLDRIKTFSMGENFLKFEYHIQHRPIGLCSLDYKGIEISESLLKGYKNKRAENMTKEKNLEIIGELIRRCSYLMGSIPYNGSEIPKFNSDIKSFAIRAFGKDSENIKSLLYNKVGNHLAKKSPQDFVSRMRYLKGILESWRSEIELFEDDNYKKSESINGNGVNIMADSKKNIWEEIETTYGINKNKFGRGFNFVKNEYKRKIIYRDVEQAYYLSKNDFYKPAVILAGSVIEELLRLYIEYKGLKPSRNSFEEYLKLCESNGLLKSSINKFSDSIRQFRNLVHLEKEKSNKDKISKSTAIGAVSCIFSLVDDFAK